MDKQKLTPEQFDKLNKEEQNKYLDCVGEYQNETN